METTGRARMAKASAIISAPGLGSAPVIGPLWGTAQYRKPMLETAPKEQPSTRQLHAYNSVAELKEELTKFKPREVKPQEHITVRGKLFPCALLNSGWWANNQRMSTDHIMWRPGFEYQRWQYHGFNVWAPSWDFTWDFEHSEQAEDPTKPPHFYWAQLGDMESECDEAESIAVLIPKKLYKLVHKRREEIGKSVLRVDIQGLLTHKTYFKGEIPDDEKNLLDYCIRVDPDRVETDKRPTHFLRPLIDENRTFYSGYLWKCVVPSKLWKKYKAKELQLGLEHAYFLWAHTNFGNPECVADDLEVLEKKLEIVKKREDDDVLELLQKSSFLVPGDCKLPLPEFKELIFGKRLTV
jgi:hypothetical protein